MVILKRDSIKIIICLALLVLFTAVNYNKLVLYYNEAIQSTGIVNEKIETKVKEENNRAIGSEQEYQKLIGATENEDNNLIEKSGIKDLSLHSKASLLLDASNNRVLYEENGYKEMAMASTTKIMTCIVALENAKLDSVVNVSAYASKMPDVQLKIRAGEQYYLKDMLYALMLESHNDVAVAVAEHVGGSVEGFANMMNDKARSIGCTNTNFVTPNGLDANQHYTTARDLAVIASYAIKNENFIEITNTTSHSFQEITKGRKFVVMNKNRFLYMMEGAIGVKTGFTNDAGYCFVGAIKRPDKTLISVVLGCGWPPNKSLKWHDTKELMNYGIDHYKNKQIFEKTSLNPIFVDNGQERYEKLNLEGNLSLLMRDDETVKVVYDLPKKLQAPVIAGSTVGYVKYYINDLLYSKIPIYAAEDIKKINLSFCLKKLLRLWSMSN